MDSYLRKFFLANLTIDLNFADDGEEWMPPTGLWGPKYWYTNERWRYYLTNPSVDIYFYPQLVN